MKVIMPDYKGIVIRADEGLHEECFTLIKQYVPEGGRVLDIAAGAGAFSARLFDAGFEVTANDIDIDAWSAGDMRKFSVDLNKPFDPQLFSPAHDLVAAMEVIEHLQNPTKLLEDCRKLVKPGGYILISTPNILDKESRLIFLRKGMFYHFSPQSYFATGHRTILPQWLLELLFEEVGLEVVERRLGGFHPGTLRGWNIKSWITFVAIHALKPFMKKQSKTELDSNYLVYLLRSR
jgi:2-polyprenyl-3-methyl-5-hydroxy-6-metoxy-1,4-benzoquinol methylase